jgi:hypothetical protein
MDTEKNVVDSYFDQVEGGVDANWASRISDDVAKNDTAAQTALLEPAAQAKIM